MHPGAAHSGPTSCGREIDRASQWLSAVGLDHATLAQCHMRHSTECLQVLQGLTSESDWARVRQLVVEVHSEELLVQVEALARQHFDLVEVDQDKHMQHTQLYMLHAYQDRSATVQQPEASAAA
jgi:hypothetical protein